MDHISQRADEYAIFFEDDAEFRAYASEMRKPRTWGDELTLRSERMLQRSKGELLHKPQQLLQFPEANILLPFAAQM